MAELEEGRAHLEALRLGWPSALYSEPGLQRARVIGGKDFWLTLPIELFPQREKELSFLAASSSVSTVQCRQEYGRLQEAACKLLSSGNTNPPRDIEIAEAPRGNQENA